MTLSTTGHPNSDYQMSEPRYGVWKPADMRENTVAAWHPIAPWSTIPAAMPGVALIRGPHSTPHF